MKTTNSQQEEKSTNKLLILLQWKMNLFQTMLHIYTAVKGDEQENVQY